MRKKVFTPLGASNHSEKERAELDFYATEPRALELLLEQESFNLVWEPACGLGHLSDVLKKHGIHELSSDIVYRGYEHGILIDFFDSSITSWPGDIITNPPYNKGVEFVKKAIDIVGPGCKVAMFLKLQFLETKLRREFFKEYPPKVIYVSSSRLLCARNGDFMEARKMGSAVAYAWFVWYKGFNGDPIVKWIN